MTRKIQVRRGPKADLPTLDQGEIGFTLDTKELFIGGTSGTGNVDITQYWKFGDLSALTTAIKASLVGAINELDEEIGDISTLDTTDKTKLVKAINETLKQAKQANDDLIQREINIRQPPFNARGDDTFDDTAAINSAIATAVALGRNIYFPKAVGKYRTTDTINVPALVGVRMESDILYDGPAGKTALVIGTPGVSNAHTGLTVRVNRKTTSTWLDEADIGVKIINSYYSKVVVQHARGFTIGAQLIGEGGGFSYNSVEFPALQDNKISLDLSNISYAGKIGWFNENVFSNGRAGVSSTLKTTISRIGIRMRSIDGTYDNNNNNYFLKPCFEMHGMNVTGGAECIPVLIEHGRYNEFLSCRNESNGSFPFARILNNSDANHFDIGYNANDLQRYTDLIDDQTGNEGTTLRVRNHTAINARGTTIFSSGHLPDKMNSYNLNRLYIEGVHFALSGNSTVVNNIGYTKPLDVGYIELASSLSVGVFIDTESQKRFVVRTETIKNYHGRIRIVCYGADGSILLDDSLGKRLYGAASKQFAASSYGGSFVNGADNDTPYLFKVGEHVKKVRILLGGGTNPIRLKSFTIESLDGRIASVFTGTNSRGKRAVVEPTAGSFRLADEIHHDTPTPGGLKGWSCVVAGTANKTAWAATTAYTVGQQVNAGNKVYECTVAGTSGSAAPAHATGTAADGTVTWKYVDVLAVFDRTGQVGVLTSVSAAPSFVGQVAVVSGITYTATGTSTAADWKRTSVYNQKTGTLTYSGDGVATTKTIPHGMGAMPTFHQVTPSSVDAGTAGIKFVTADATNLTVTFNTAPIAGTNNVSLTWKTEV